MELSSFSQLTILGLSVQDIMKVSHSNKQPVRWNENIILSMFSNCYVLDSTLHEVCLGLFQILGND